MQYNYDVQKSDSVLTYSDKHNFVLKYVTKSTKINHVKLHLVKSHDSELQAQEEVAVIHKTKMA